MGVWGVCHHMPAFGYTPPVMDRLPIDEVLPQVVTHLRTARSLVLVAPPGAGKTTRVPPAVLAANLLDAAHPNLVILQPRRVAARAVAMRIAEEQGWTLGREVGYHVRFDRKITHGTRLRVLTEGILTRQLLDDPLLEGIGCVILDEFHERNLNTDLAVALLKEVQEARPDLILIVMSATLEAEPVSRYLGGCPIIHSAGRSFPVQVSYRPTAVTGRIEQHVAAVVDELLSGADADADEGDILIFLPGAEEIRRTLAALAPLGRAYNRLLLPLHGSLPAEDQMRAIRPARQGKIICATNIAETSLTIEGVTTVIDSGLARVAGYDPQRGLDRLELKRISQASAVQRAGRAGRVRPGCCVRLMSEKDFHALDAFELPEVKRVDLAQTVLSLHAWGRPDPRAFPWYESPDEAAIAAAERLLEMLGALAPAADGFAITPLGRQILAIPTHPRLARLLLAARQAGLVREGATLAALLSEKDIFITSRPERGMHDMGGALASRQAIGDSDLLLRLEALEHPRHRPEVDPAAVRQVLRVRDELLRIAGSSRTEHGGRHAAHHAQADPGELLRLPLVAYPDRVCKRRTADPALGVMVGGGGVRLAEESMVREGDFFLALDARHDARSMRSEALVRIASRVEQDWLESLFPHVLRTERTSLYDPARQRVVGMQRIWYRDLLLREHPTGEIDPAQAERALFEALAPRAAELIESDEHLAPLMQRLNFLARALPDGRPASTGETDEMAIPDARLLLADACVGATSLQQVRRNLKHAIDARLTYDLRRWLDEHAPETITVPTGNRIRLDWSAATTEPELRGPVLAVRLQELFGLPDTPRIAAGRVPVVLHLLGPNYRPVQVTSDLASFWKNTYPQVRKDLRARYPKHAWPDDPLAARPEAKGGRRR